MTTGYYLKEFAQAVNGDVRCEVLYVDDSIGVCQAMRLAPIPDASIGKGTGAWTNADLAAACGKALGVTVWLMPVAAVPVAEVAP